MLEKFKKVQFMSARSGRICQIAYSKKLKCISINESVNTVDLKAERFKLRFRSGRITYCEKLNSQLCVFMKNEKLESENLALKRRFW